MPRRNRRNTHKSSNKKSRSDRSASSGSSSSSGPSDGFAPSAPKRDSAESKPAGHRQKPEGSKYHSSAPRANRGLEPGSFVRPGSQAKTSALPADDRAALGRMLRPSAPPPPIEGRVEIHPDGFGFLIAKDPSLPNIYVGEESLKYVMHRDEVRVRIDPRDVDKDRIRGEVCDILVRRQKEFLGLVRHFKGGSIVVPTEARDRHHGFKLVAPTPDPWADIKSGTPVLAKILTYPEPRGGTVQIVNVVDEPQAASNDTLRILLAAGWPREFSRVAISEAEHRASRWKENLGHHRRDIRHLNLVTIDGRDARDFDDAVCALVESGGNLRLWVAIADVSLFVKPGTVLDREAYERATSVYFPDHVVPMLPEVLSNGVCSLNPFEERACLVAEMVVSKVGQITSFEMYEGLMQSKRRLTYEQMQAFMEKEVWARQDMEELTENLEAIVEAYKRLRRSRTERGSIDLDLPEAQVILKSDGTVLDIQSRARLDAHRLIEECMLAANQCAAKFLQSHFSAAMYRIHEAPDERKVADLIRFVGLCGLDLTENKFSHSKAKKNSSAPSGQNRDKPDPTALLSHPKDYARLLERLKVEFEPGDAKARAIQSLVLRSLKQARYGPARLGHFALATEDYTHFTSPIRRYPDLIVHRLIKEGLKVESIAGVTSDLEAQGRHCSDQERGAMDCERKVVDTKKCRYMEKKLGEEFEAWVSGVTEKGLFCQIEGHFVDGLMSSESVARKGKFRFSAEELAYIAPGKTRLELGSRVKIQVAAVDIELRRIDFEPIEVY